MIYNGTNRSVKMCQHLSLIHCPDIWGQEENKEKGGHKCAVSAFYHVTSIVLEYVTLCNKKWCEKVIISFSYSTDRRWTLVLTGGQDTNLKQFSVKVCSKVSRIPRKVEKEKLFQNWLQLSPLEVQEHAAWDELSAVQIYFCFSCWQKNQNKKNSAGARGGRGASRHPPYLALSRFSAIFLHNEHIMPTAHRPIWGKRLEGAQNSLFHQIISVQCQDKSLESFLTVL